MWRRFTHQFSSNCFVLSENVRFCSTVQLGIKPCLSQLHAFFTNRYLHLFVWDRTLFMTLIISCISLLINFTSWCHEAKMNKNAILYNHIDTLWNDSIGHASESTHNYSQPSMSRYWRDHRLMEISSHGTAILWKAASRDHHSNHEIMFLVWFHESISSNGTLTHGGLTAIMRSKIYHVKKQLLSIIKS